MSRNMTILARVLVSMFAGLALAACAHHREMVRQEKAEVDRAAQAVRDCIVKFVLETDSPRLTGFELADAGASACGGTTLKLRRLMEDQGYDPPEISALAAASIKEGQGDALAALAGRDKKNEQKRLVSDPIN